MATVDILDLIKLGDLSPEQKAHLKSVLRKRKQKLEKLLSNIDRGISMLGGGGASKRRAKRRKKK
jgi:hypothetical protein